MISKDLGNQSYSKRKVTKTSKTIDLSEIENIPDKYIAHIRKSSCDSVSSNKTIESSRSSNIENYRGEDQISISHSKIPSDKARRVLLGDRCRNDGEVDKNVVNSRDNEPVWHKREQYSSNEYNSEPSRTWKSEDSHSSIDSHASLNSNFNQPVRRLDSGPLPVHRQIRFNQDGKLVMEHKTEPRKDHVEIVFVNAAIEKSPTKSSVSTIPEVPLRTIRKSKRDHMCRSAGEEIIERTPSIDGKAAAFLGTISEDHSQRRTRLSGGESDATTRFVNNERLSPSHFSKRHKNSSISSLDTLRRRNSDPATKVATVDSNPDGSQSITSNYVPPVDWKHFNAHEFSLEGHKFHRVPRFNKEDKCVSCNNTIDQFVTPGYKCSECKRFFHTKCIQNGAVHKAPCNAAGQTGVRRKPRKHQRTAADALSGNFNLTGTSEFQDSKDQIIAGAKELQNMQDFITKKMYKMESEVGEKPSEVDRVFKHALQEFKDNLVASYSVANRQGVETLNIKYKDLIANFIHVMETVCSQESKTEGFAVTMCVNAFRGFMDEFMHSRAEAEKPKAKRKKEKKRKAEDHVYAGHTFVLTIINIPTACEICTSFFMWPIERGLVCQACKLTCHKKCYIKVTQECGGCKDNVNIGLRIFGVALHKLTAGDGKIPVVIDRLITTIEMYGLYTEGIYRKSGLSSKVKELKSKMDESDQGTIKFEGYPVHVLAAVLKSFLRDMPEPLLTFDCYDDFIRAANLTDPADKVSTLFTILKKLPKCNFVLMERLIFHLARVALHEETNRMNASALAIVFAPCILRTNKPLPAQDSLQDIGRQTQCIETIITEQMRKVRMTLADINTLDTACHTATHRLSSLRSSKIFSPEELLPPSQEQQGISSPDREDEEAILVGHIEEIQKEKALLTSALPSLTRATSDDDLLSTDLDGEGSLDDISTTNDPPKKTKVVITRSISGGHCTNSAGNSNSHLKLPRQSSSEQQTRNNLDDCEDDPIMV